MHTPSLLAITQPFRGESFPMDGSLIPARISSTSHLCAYLLDYDSHSATMLHLAHEKPRVIPGKPIKKPEETYLILPGGQKLIPAHGIPGPRRFTVLWNQIEYILESEKLSLGTI